MKKPLLIVGGSLLALIGLGILVGGVALLVLFGTDGQIESGSHPVAANGRALVSEATAIVDSAPIDAGGGVRLRVAVEPTNGKEVFVGIGPADDVDTFLDGVSIDEIADFELRPYRLETTPVPGEAVPGDPNDETFWHAAASGTEGAAIDWKVEAGTFRLVIMNVDSSTGVEANGKLGVKVPFTVPAGITRHRAGSRVRRHRGAAPRARVASLRARPGTQPRASLPVRRCLRPRRSRA